MSKNFELLRQSGKNPIVGIPEMGRYKRLSHSPQDPRFEPPAMEHRSDWLRLVNVLRRHWRLSVFFAATVLLTAAIATLMMKPTYEPVAKIEIDPPGAEAFSLDNGNSGTNEAEYLETNAKLLQSDELAIAVIRAIRSGDAASPNNLEIKSPPDQKAKPIRLTPEENAELRDFQSHLKVQRDSASRLIYVSFASHDPQLAANAVNTLLQQFIERSYRTRLEAIKQSTEWLSRQLDDIRNKMEESNKELAQFQSVSGIAEIDDNKNTFSEQLSELSRQRTLAQAERIQLGSVIKNVEGQSADVLPQVQTNLVVQNLTQKLADVRGELSKAQVIYGKNHPEVRKLKNQADELDKEIHSQRASIWGGLKNSYTASQARERAIGSEMRSTTKELNQLSRYSALKKEAQANAELYNALFRRIKEAGISAGSKSSGIRVMDAARVLDQPTRPRRMLNIAVGLLVGLIGGVAIAYLKDAFDNTIRTPEDLASLGASSSISVVPLIANGNGNHFSLFPGVRRETGADKFMLDRPRSPESEALRGLRTSLMLSRLGKSPQALLITSSFPGEGKTTVAVNLALALAQSGRTCLVEADLRKTGMSRVFGVDGKYGLIDVLNGSVDVERVLLDVPDVPRLTILPAGGVSSTPELVCSESMGETISLLRQSFSFVVVDSPPILPFADGRVLSTFVDGVVLVGRSGVTTRDAMQRSLALLADIKAAPILGVVLNAADFIASQYGYSYYEK